MLPPLSASSPPEQLPLDAHMVRDVARLSFSPHRRWAARVAARHLGADDLLVFVYDPVARVPLPAPGFPQTLPDGAAWREFLGRCTPEQPAYATLRHSFGGEACRAVGIGSPGRAMLVALGGDADLRRLRTLSLLLPMLAVTFGHEQAERAADARVRVAEDAASHALGLTIALDAARRDLQRALQIADDGQRRLTFLAAAGALLASSLDYGTMLRQLVQLAVPALADLCGIAITDPTGTARWLEVAHSLDAPCGALEEQAREQWPLDGRGDTGSVAHTLQTGESVLISDVDAAWMERTARDEDHLALLRASGLRSFMVVPLRVDGRIVGAFACLSIGSQRRFGPEDLALAEELARRAGLAMANALQYEELQRALLAQSIAAHELRTPITGLRGFAQLLLHRLDTPSGLDQASLRTMLERIDSAAGKLLRLVALLLDAARIESGQLVVERTLVDVATLAREAVETARGTTRRHVITLVASVSIPAFLDALRIEQVLSNLLDNAIKYSPTGGAITVDVDVPEPATVRIAVEDRGLGILPAHRPYIFDRKYRAPGEQQVSGLGIGLYVSRQIVLRHGGRIDAQFPTEGGTRMIVTLPVGPVAPER